MSASGVIQNKKTFKTMFKRNLIIQLLSYFVFDKITDLGL